MVRYRKFVDMNCMPMPFGLLCLLESYCPRRDSEAIHRECPLVEECDLRHTAKCTKRCHVYCVPVAVGLRHPGTDCKQEDFLCKVHDSTLEILARLNIPICRGTWRRQK